MTALQVIIKEAKAIRSKNPKMEWKKAVAQASAIYASKHKGKSPVGKKKAVKKVAKKKLGALPIGFKGSIWGVKFKIVNQYDIYNDVSAIMEDTENGSVIVVFDGKGSANDKASIVVSYMSRYGKLPYGKIDDKDRNELKSKMIKFATNMQKEVKEYNAGKKKTIKKQPLNISAPKIKAPIVKKAVKKVAKKATKKHTHWKKVHAHERRVNGVGAVKKSATTMHKDTKSHNVNIRVMSGIGATKISFEKLEKAIKNAAEYKHIINNINKELILNKNMPSYLKKDLKDTKKTFNSMLKEEKTHITELKKHIK
jgi:hypothetical protein